MSVGTRSNSPISDTSGISSIGTSDVSDAVLIDLMVSHAELLVLLLFFAVVIVSFHMRG